MKIKTLLLLAILISAYSITWGQTQYMMMTVDAVKQGKFKGESSKPGSTLKIEVLAYFQEIQSPRDAATGQASGKRQHQPISFWKLSGAASPQFFQALVNNEELKNVTFEFFRSDDMNSKSEVLQYKIELSNARVAGYRQIMGMPDGVFKATSVNLYDEIKLTFDKITVTSSKGGNMATDDWRSIN